MVDDVAERLYYAGAIGDTILAPDTVRTSYDVMGRILTVENLTRSRVLRTWNKEGTLKTETQTLKTPTPPPATTFRYTYNRANQRASLNTSLYNRTFTYSYGTGGVLNSIAQPGVWSVQLRHDALGRRDSVAYPNGSVAKYRFDEDGRIRKVEVTRLGNALLDLEFSAYDGVGRVLSASKWRSGMPQPELLTWNYRLRGFLRRHAAGSYDSEFSYDEAGNLTRKSDDGVVSTYTHRTGSNQLQSRQSG